MNRLSIVPFRLAAPLQALLAVMVMTGLAACAARPAPVDDSARAGSVTGPGGESPAASLGVSACANDTLTAFDRLIVIAPHPDDEILGFAGLIDAYLRAGKPVRTLIVTDGDAYCEACALWTTGSTQGTPCTASELSNFDTPEIDSLAEARRLESIEAARRVGAPAPEFLGYPDTGLAYARRLRDAGEPGAPLRRSDFSGCVSCGACDSGYGGGPLTGFSAATLARTLEAALAQAGSNTLVATTHELDGHQDHAATADFVRRANARIPQPHTLAFAVIHAHTNKGHAFADCWYPAPAAEHCPCNEEALYASWPELLPQRREARRRPGSPQRLPDDAHYGIPRQLCLDPELILPDGGLKARAIEAFETQLGTTSLVPGVLPESLRGVLDCSGYLGAFGRRTEVFVLEQL